MLNNKTVYGLKIKPQKNNNVLWFNFCVVVPKDVTGDIFIRISCVRLFSYICRYIPVKIYNSIKG